MKTSRSDRDITIPAGDIEFFDKIVPPLMAGDYSVKLSQDLSFDNVDESFIKTQKFSVQGPRFKLNDSDVQSVFPAAGSTGKYENILPQIVFKKRSLPWEHVLEKGENSGAPWLALLVFDVDQIIVPVDSANKPTKTNAVLFKLGDVRNLNSGGILGPSIPHLDYGQSDSDTCHTIDISTETFKSLVPYLDSATPEDSELTTLAHCREVNMEHKEILKMKHSGWFSVVLANRFPINPDKPTLQFVHLVSIEGFKPYLDDSSTFPKGITRIRLISLHSWSFTSLPEQGENFSSFMLHLVSQPSKLTTNLLLKLPLVEDASSTDTSPNKIASKALDNGYVPLVYNARYGDKTLSWYRGPLSPVKPDDFTHNASIFRFTNSSEAVIYDPDTGLFNMSYSVAWQTGRLMALASQGFSTSLLGWRRQINRIIDLLSNLAQEDKIANFMSNYDSGINQWFHDQLITESFMDFLVGDFAKEIAPKVTDTPIDTISTQAKASDSNTTPSDDDLPPQLVKELQKLMENEQVKALLKEIEGDEFENIVEWLARTALLYDVPFDHLVPDARLLPIESIRFFYLDRSWIDSLIDGAMSAGIQSSKDSYYYKITKDLIRDTVDRLMLQIREKLLGLTITDKDPTDGVISGFLLRSAVLTQYPGIEIKGYKTVSQNDEGTLQGEDRMQILRMERLSSNVLICLFPDTPAWIEFDEPKEGLYFSVESVEEKLKIAIRNPKDGEVIPNGYYTLDDVTDYRGDKSNRVLNIKHLKEELAKKLGKATLTSADFALQMVKIPEQMVFQNKE